MSRHPVEETLAAFADGRLDAYGRDEVIAHLAMCDECRAIYDMVMDAQDAEIIERAATVVVRGDFGRRNAVIAALATAAALTVVFFTPPVQQKVASYRTGGVSDLVAATDKLPKRDVEARLTGGFPYKAWDEPTRSGEEKPLDYTKTPLAIAQHRIEERGGESAKALRAQGLAHLLNGERAEAIKTLERALAAAGGNDAQLLTDLSAAYLAKARFESDDDAAKRALDLTEQALRITKTPEALWNRALALQYLGRHEDAIAAWNDYLAVDDDTSPWADEVRNKHIPYSQDPL